MEIEAIPRVNKDLEHGSDHLPIETTLRIRGLVSSHSLKPSKRLWNSLDSEIFLSTFNREASCLDTLPLDTRDLIDHYIDLFREAIRRAIELAVPFKRGSFFDKGF